MKYFGKCQKSPKCQRNLSKSIVKSGFQNRDFALLRKLQNFGIYYPNQTHVLHLYSSYLMFKTIPDGFSKNGNNPPNLSSHKVPDHAKNHVFYYISDETKPVLGGYLMDF